MAASTLAAGVSAVSLARADVISIGDDGAVTAYSAPMVFTEEGAAPIAGPELSGARQATGVVRTALLQAAVTYDVDPRLLEAVAWQESRLMQQSVSPKGAVGVMQLMPATARELGVDPQDLKQNILGGAAYLSRMLRRYRGDVALSLAAYYADPGAVDRHGGVPPYAETRAYVGSILERLSLSAR